MIDELETLVNNLVVDMGRSHHFEVLRDCEKITDLIAAIRKVAIDGVEEFAGDLQRKANQSKQG